MGVSFCLVWFFWGVLMGICLVGRQFQCRQCQDLLENNVAHKRPIEGVVRYHAWGVFVMLMFVFYSPGGEEESGSEADCC